MAPLLSRLSDKLGITFGSAAGGAASSGGYVINDGGYTYHVFHSLTSEPNVLTLVATKTVEFLMIAGGGGGGARYGTNRASTGGGGAGGVVWSPDVIIPAGEYPVTVGTGGFGPVVAETPGVNGTDSTFMGYTAKGGGGGGAADYTGPVGAGLPGGSGGGANQDYPSNRQPGGTATQPGTSQSGPQGYGYGYAGGAAGGYPGGSGGGGGGAGGVGGPGVSNAGTGGDGRPFSSFPGPVIAQSIPIATNPNRGNVAYRTDFISAVGPTGIYAGGGGGISYPGSPAQSGGTGGGGTGGLGGVAFTGSGASGNQCTDYPGSTPDGTNYGAEGIVIIKYLSS